MEEDVRTKNLTLRDIHVGDWVQVWNETTKSYSQPSRIVSIYEDGIVYLVTNDKEGLELQKENIKNVDALPIHIDLLKGFGFEKMTFGGFRYKEYPFKYSMLTGILYIENVASPIEYFHDLQDDLAKYLPEEQLKFEWKGVKNERKI